MADELQPVGQLGNSKRLKDEGDGSFAEVVALAAGTVVVTAGGVAAGAAVTGNPVLVGGKDGSGNAQFLALDTAGVQLVQGNVAAGVADSGNPVEIGGFASAAAPTAVTAGQRVRAWYTLNGQAVAVLGDAASPGSIARVVAPSDGQGSVNTLAVLALPSVFNGATTDRLRGPNVFKFFDGQAVTAGTPVALWTPAAGKKFRLMRYHLSLSVAGRVKFKDGATLVLTTPDMAAGVGQPSPNMGNGILSAAANNALSVDVSATGNVSGWVCGTEE